MNKRRLLWLGLGVLIILVVVFFLLTKAGHKIATPQEESATLIAKSVPSKAPMPSSGMLGMGTLSAGSSGVAMMGPQQIVGTQPRMMSGEYRIISAIHEELSLRLVIKTGTMKIIVKDIKEALQAISRFAEEKEGWVVSKNMDVEEETLTGEITIRVPAKDFDKALAYIRSLAEKVTSERVEGQDVTEEYIDLKARLKNLEATEAQLLKIMQRAGKVSDILIVYRELSNIREEIERVKGRIQYLEESTQMSTITVYLSLPEGLQPIPPAEKWQPGYILKRAWRSALLVLRLLSYVLIWIGVFGIIWIPLWGIIWWINRSHKRNKTS